MRIVSATRVLLAGAVVAAGALSGCGSSADEPAATGSGGTITVDGISFPKPEKTSLKFGVSALSVGDMPAYMIDYQKLGEKFGIDIKMSLFNGDAPTRQALVAGQIDIADVSGGVSVSSQKTNSPTQITFSSQDKLSDLFVGGKNITDANALRGKAVAVSSFGSQSYAGALLALKSMGLSKDDVTISPVGNDAARLSALRAGSVGAAIVDADKGPELNQLGFHTLADLGKLDVAGYVTASLAMPKKFIDRYPNTALALTAMYQMGRWTTYSDVPTAAKAWAEQAEIPESEAADEVKVRNEVQRPLDGRCNPEVMDFVKEVLTATDSGLTAVDAKAACTNQFIDKLKQMGFQKKLGVTGY
jgi:ABC-type nitrate/sulfonate/bicarbonate transport system substrate-binding protein